MKATRLVAMLPVLMLAAVAATPSPTQAIAIADAEEPAMQLYVNNENALDVEVYLEIAQGERSFLGRVRAGTQRTFDIDEAAVAGIEAFRIRLQTLEQAGSGTLVDDATEAVKTQLISVDRGEKVNIVVRNPLTTSGIVQS